LPTPSTLHFLRSNCTGMLLGPQADGDEYRIPIDRKSCSLLGPTALLVQGLMGILVILALVYKRHREPRKRPWRIWFFDVSKQVFGQAFVHSLNLLISGLGAIHSSRGKNACVFYFFNVLIDTTLGVAIIYGLLHLVNYILINKFQLKGFMSGEYGSPPSWLNWARQTVVYAVVLTAMKLMVIAILAIWPGLIDVGAWLLGWTGNGGNFQIIFVMGIFPIVMNIVQFWIIDTIVKARDALSTPIPTPRDEAEEPFLDPAQHGNDEDTLSGDIESGTEAQKAIGSSSNSVS